MSEIDITADKVAYKIVDLFGNEQIMFSKRKAKDNKTLFNKYDEFVAKFEVKKTTDDCYTPDNIYKLILDYCRKNYDIDGSQVVRPFFPGGDYQAINYSPEMVVIDNPPFSIVTEIVNYYIDNNIRFFLFAPHLTLFNPARRCTAIITDYSITYENGAKVNTGFVTNMAGDIAVIGDVELKRAIERADKGNKAVNTLPSYTYPDEVVTVSEISKKIKSGWSIVIDRSNAFFVRGLDDQRKHKKAIFGAGYLVNPSLVRYVAVDGVEASEDETLTIEWQLSERERKIIKTLK